MSAEYVARATRLHEETRSLYHAALSREEAIKTRILDAETRQKAITQARLDGASNEAETAEFGALAADIEALQEMLETAKTETVKAEEPMNRAQAMLQTAQAMHQRELAQMSYDALLIRVQALEGALCSAVATLHDAGLQLGFVSLSRTWPVSQSLRRAIENGIVPPKV